MNMEEPAVGPQEGVLEGWLLTGIWYLVASLLAAWALLQNCHNVSGAPDMVEKAMQVVRETLEKPSPQGSHESCGLSVSFSL